MAEEDPSSHNHDEWIELFSVVLLSVTAILTAWTGFQSSKWGGAMSISFAQASTARIEATQLEGDANRKGSIQVAMFTQWAQAAYEKDKGLETFLEARFPEPLNTAFDAWIALDPLNNPAAPASPFQMPEYQIPELAESNEADARADAKYDEALENNQRGDNYTVLTVLFAIVLFFTAMATRIRSRRSRMGLLIAASTLFVVGVGLLISLPKLI